MATLEFFFDIASPYSYLASTQIDDLARSPGAEVRWRPFLLGGVFKAVGNEAPAILPARGKYLGKDLQRWAKRYGAPLNWPSRFPINTITAQRMLIAAEREGGSDAVQKLATAFYTAYWVDDADVSDAEVLAAKATEAGFDGEALARATQDQDVKDALRAATDEAVERGAFGAPTFFVGDEMFFGNDRLALVEEALAAE